MENIFIDQREIKALGLNLNEYLSLMYINGVIDYKCTTNDLNRLVELGYIVRLGDNYILSPKSINYFQSSELFREFYNVFPHTVPDKVGDSRPLRTLNEVSQAGLITKGIWKKKVRGNINLQNHIIDVLKAEIDWRNNTGSLPYMNNIDTWLRQHNWEKYEYLLNQTTTNNRI